MNMTDAQIDEKVKGYIRLYEEAKSNPGSWALLSHYEASFFGFEKDVIRLGEGTNPGDVVSVVVDRESKRPLMVSRLAQIIPAHGVVFSSRIITTDFTDLGSRIRERYVIKLREHTARALREKAENERRIKENKKKMYEIRRVACKKRYASILKIQRWYRRRKMARTLFLSQTLKNLGMCPDVKDLILSYL